jgi:hypothetical protein
MRFRPSFRPRVLGLARQEKVVDTSNERDVAGDVERQLSELRTTSPSLSELPITPLRGLPDLVRLELALRQFAGIHRSGRNKALIRTIKSILSVARERLLGTTAVSGSGLQAEETAFPDTQPATHPQI